MPTDEPVVASGTGGGGRPDPAANSDRWGLVQVGFLTGALLLFLGVGLLMRVRHRLLGVVTGGTDRTAWRAARPARGLFRRGRRPADSGADGTIDLGTEAGYGRPVWQTDESTIPVWRRTPRGRR